LQFYLVFTYRNRLFSQTVREEVEKHKTVRGSEE